MPYLLSKKGQIVEEIPNYFDFFLKKTYLTSFIYFFNLVVKNIIDYSPIIFFEVCRLVLDIIIFLIKLFQKNYPIHS